ncbi:hypothetical protein BKA81DRAFT_213838 [Phyllosticta paracitricarpa]
MAAQRVIGSGVPWYNIWSHGWQTSPAVCSLGIRARGSLLRAPDVEHLVEGSGGRGGAASGQDDRLHLAETALQTFDDMSCRRRAFWLRTDAGWVAVVGSIDSGQNMGPLASSRITGLRLPFPLPFPSLRSSPRSPSTYTLIPHHHSPRLFIPLVFPLRRACWVFRLSSLAPVSLHCRSASARRH